MMQKIQLCKAVILNGNNISQFCIFDQINAGELKRLLSNMKNKSY